MCGKWAWGMVVRRREHGYGSVGQRRQEEGRAGTGTKKNERNGAETEREWRMPGKCPPPSPALACMRSKRCLHVLFCMGRVQAADLIGRQKSPPPRSWRIILCACQTHRQAWLLPPCSQSQPCLFSSTVLFYFPYMCSFPFLSVPWDLSSVCVRAGSSMPCSEGLKKKQKQEGWDQEKV